MIAHSQTFYHINTEYYISYILYEMKTLSTLKNNNILVLIIFVKLEATKMQVET